MNRPTLAKKTLAMLSIVAFVGLPALAFPPTAAANHPMCLGNDHYIETILGAGFALNYVTSGEKYNVWRWQATGDVNAVTLQPLNGDADLVVMEPETCTTFFCESTAALVITDACTVSAGEYHIIVEYYSGELGYVTYALTVVSE